MTIANDDAVQSSRKATSIRLSNAAIDARRIAATPRGVLSR